MIQSERMVDSPPSIPDFTLLRRIGRGSYGDVWLARSVTGVYRAVKVVYRSRFDEDRPYEREFAGIRQFEPISVGQETQVSLLHVGRNDAEGFFYYVLELADDAETGEQIIPETYVPKTLKEMRARRTRIPAAECALVGVGLTRALAHLHRYGLVHRDIKPSNVIFVHGVPKLADIGLVSAVDASASFVGTEGFVPPEGPGSVQADLYSLGKVLYEISTGRDRKDFPKLPDDIDALPDARALLELNEVMLKACDSDVRRRYSSAQAMHDDLVLLQAGKSVKRLHLIERRLRIAAKYGVAATALAIVTAAAFLWASSQARKAKENFALSERHRLAAEKALRESQINQARAQRMTGVAGRRFDTLELLRKSAAHISPRADQADYRLKLRNEAIACVALPDIRPVKQWARPLDSRWTCDSDLRRYFTNDSLGKIVMRDIETHAQLAELPGLGAAVDVMMLSGDDHFLASSDKKGKARLWDLPAKTSLPLEFPAGARFACFTPDSRSLVVRHANASLHFLDTASGLEQRKLDGPFPSSWIVFSPDGQKFCGVEEQDVLVFEAATGTLLTTLPHRQNVFVVAWHPDSHRLASAGGDKAVHFWNIATNRELTVLEGHQSPVVGLAFEQGGEWLVSAAWDDTTRLWNLETHRELLRLSHSGNGIRMSRDGGRLAFSQWDHSNIELWELAAGREVRRFQVPTAVRHCYSAGFSPNGRLIHIHDSDGISLFEPPCQEAIAVATTRNTFTAAAFHPSNSLITSGSEGLQWWPLEFTAAGRAQFGTPKWLGFVPGMRVHGFSITPDGERLTASSDDGFRILNPMNPGEILHARANRSPTGAASISADGKWVATGSHDNRTMHIWDARTCKLVTNLTVGYLSQAFFSPDNRWFVTAGFGEHRLWEIGSWKPGVRIKSPSMSKFSLSTAFTTDGKVMALKLSEQGVGLFATGSDRELATLPSETLLTHLCFSPDDTQLLMTYEPGYAQLWDLRLIRQELADMGLDWDQPSFGSNPEQNRSRKQLEVTTTDHVSLQPR